MAEEKKFLDETMEQPKNRKLVAKNIVLAFVVFVILLLCVLAWFTSRSDATASGLSVKTSGESGLEVSLDGGQHWSAKWSSDEVEGEEGWQISDELKKFASGGSLMQLLSGNGKDLYYTKSVDANGDAKDSDFVKISDDKAGDYCLEFEAYFRSENQCSVALTDQSKVEPFNLTDNMWTQSTPSFSANYIAGAARVAFLEKRGTESAPTWAKTGLWIPNPKYQLTTTSSENVKYTKMPDNYGGSVDISSGGQATDTTGTGDYYLWTLSAGFTLNEGNDVEYNRAALSNLYSIPLQRIGTTDKYYCQFYTVIPQSGRIEQMIMINNSKTEWQETASNVNGINQYVTGTSNASGLNVDWWAGKTYNVSVEYDGSRPNNFDYDTYYFYQIYYGKNTITDSAKKLVRIEYDRSTKQITLCNPDKSDITINAPENTGMLQEDERIVVTKDSTIGLGPGLSGQDPKLTGNSSSPCDLVVSEVKLSGDHDCSYKFSFENQYLAVVDGKLTTVESKDQASYFYVLFGTQFEGEGDAKITDKLLGYIDRSSSTPVVKYVVYNSSTEKFELSTSYGEDRYMIYQKTTTSVKNYKMLTDGTPETEDESWGKNYYYFNGATKASLKSSEYMTSLDDPKNKDLVKLETQETIGNKTYYTGKMKVRIYAEGFDREAQKPMEKGKIKVNLQFTATTIS